MLASHLLPLLLPAGLAAAILLAPRAVAAPSQEQTPSIPPRNDANEVAGLYLGVAAPPLLANLDPPSYEVGHTDLFWVATLEPGYFQIQAEIRLITPHAYWYVQQGANVNDEALRRGADDFENTVYPQVRRWVYSELFPGVDNDPHLTVLNGRVPGVAGYASSVDMYSAAVRQFSNERDMVYINVESAQPGTTGYGATIAHEFTHLAHEALTPSADTWVKEGLAEFISSVAVPARNSAYRTFLDRPETSLVSWGDAPAGSEHYQAAELFMRYFTERFGSDGLSQLLTLELPAPDAFDRVLGGLPAPSDFDGLFQDWVAANAFNNKTGASVPGYQIGTVGSPHTQSLGSSGAKENSLAPFSSAYYELDGGPQAEFQFAGSSAVAPLSAAPRHGSSMWQGGYTDGSRATMTRAFDLSGVAGATLTYSAWFDLEKDYDYGYVAVSRDGGHSWALLTASSMTSANASGANLGAGYTGLSGGGPQAQWLDETIDLTPYTGGSILLQFVYLTDDAVTHPGLAVDDIAIPELGYFDGAEAINDWDLRGWSVIGAPLPQKWAVQVLRFFGSTVEVERVPVDDQGHARWSADGRSSDRTLVAISSLTRGTRERATYSLIAGI
ncbi:MAG TPA: hypothetical protein VGK54_02515 [Chloroflexota bacterium]